MAPMLVDWHARYSQQARWTAPLRRYYFERIALQPGDRLLEVGCGTGAVLAQLREETISLPAVHGLDIDDSALRQAQRNAPGTCLVTGDAHHLPYAAGTFQAVICHYLLLWLDNPLAALSEMQRVTRLGGWVLALAEPDYGGRIDYPEALAELGERQREALHRQGADPTLGRKLSSLFHAAGLRDIEGGVLGSQWQGLPSAEERAQEWAVLATDLEGYLTPTELERLHQLEEQAWQHRQRVLFVPTFYCVSRK